MLASVMVPWLVVLLNEMFMKRMNSGVLCLSLFHFRLFPIQ